MRKRSLLKVISIAAAAVVLCSCSSDPKSAESAIDGVVYKNSVNTDFMGNLSEVTINEGDTYAVISIEKYGDIKIKLFPEAAPYGVKNFIALAESGYYDGKNIHRVMKDFMFQGGAVNSDGSGSMTSDGKGFYCEIDTSMRHFYGALCYGNANGVNGSHFYIVNSKKKVQDVETVYEKKIENYKKSREKLKDYDKNSYEYIYNSMMLDSQEYSINGCQFLKGKDKDGLAAKKYYEVGGVPSLDGGYTVFGQTVEGFDVIDAISEVEVVENSSMNEKSLPAEEIIISSVTIHTA